MKKLKHQKAPAPQTQQGLTDSLLDRDSSGHSSNCSLWCWLQLSALEAAEVSPPTATTLNPAHTDKCLFWTIDWKRKKGHQWALQKWSQNIWICPWWWAAVCKPLLLRNVSQTPKIQSTPEIKDGPNMVSVILDFNCTVCMFKCSFWSIWL